MGAPLPRATVGLGLPARWPPPIALPGLERLTAIRFPPSSDLGVGSKRQARDDDGHRGGRLWPCGARRLAIGAVAFRAALSPRAAVVLPTLAAAGFLLALLHWGRWLPG
jgi:hypothetical protein